MNDLSNEWVLEVDESKHMLVSTNEVEPIDIGNISALGLAEDEVFIFAGYDELLDMFVFYIYDKTVLDEQLHEDGYVTPERAYLRIKKIANPS